MSLLPMGNNDTTGGLLGGGASRGGLLGGLLPNDPRQQAWNQAAFALLATPGNIAQKIGAAGLTGLNAHQAAQQQQAAQKFREMQMQQMQSQMDEQERERKMQEQVRSAALGSVIQPQQMPVNEMEAANQAFTGDTGIKPGGFDQRAFIQKLYQIDPMQAMSMEQQLAKRNAPIEVAQGGALVDPETGKEVYRNPKEAEQTQLSRLITEMNSLAPNDPRRAIYQQMIQKTVTHQPGTKVEVNTGQKGLDNELKLSDKFRNEPIYKAHQEMQSAYNQITNALKQASPAGDMAGATKIMKLLDPGSVVRESELGMAMAATGLLDRAQNYANLVISGQKLTPSQRKDFQNLADVLFQESVKQYNAKRSEYEKFTTDYGLDPSRTVGAPATFTKPSAGEWSITPVGQ